MPARLTTYSLKIQLYYPRLALIPSCRREVAV